MAVIYHWKHGWIPLDHEAALSKARGNHARAQALLAAVHDGHTGIHTRQDVAKAVIDLPNVPAGVNRDAARHQLATAAAQHNATDLLPSTVPVWDVDKGKVVHVSQAEAFAGHVRYGQSLGAGTPAAGQTIKNALSRSEELKAAAQAKRDEAARIAGNAGVADRAAARLNPRNLAAAHRNTDSQLRRYTEATQAAQNLENKAALAASREAESSRTRLTHDQIKGATHVQDKHGQWHEVVRVNAKSVTVKTPYSWTDTIPHDKVVNVAHITPAQIAAAKARRAKAV